MSLHTEFDKGSLIWVKSEIEETFTRAQEALQRYAAGADETTLRHAQTYLHQACGALTLVDLPGVARFCEEIEQAITGIQKGAVDKDAVPKLARAIETARSFLDRLMAGMVNQPLLLLPVYREIAILNGNTASGAELFFPQLQLDLPPGLPQKTLPPGEFDAFVRQQRSRFESGLLRWLQGQTGSAQIMAASLSDVAAHQKMSVVRVFWWTAAALVLGLGSNRTPVELDSRQLMLRINLQMRRLADGSGKVAERLFRDMLYMLAQLDCDSNLVKHLQQSFELASLLPSPEALSAGVAQDGMHLARGLRDELRTVKDVWSRIAAGQTDRIGSFHAQLSTLAEKVVPLSTPALQKLLSGLEQALARYEKTAATEAESLEFATALLLVDNALAVYPDLPADYATQVDGQLQRLENPDSTQDFPQLDSISREAQERLLTAQLAQEIRASLQVVEALLDGFFRDPGARDILTGLATPLRQVQGALLMMDRPQAVQILQECQKRADAYLAGAEPEQNELEKLAEALSTVGFYIDDLEQGREKEEMLHPVLAKLRGDAAAQEDSSNVDVNAILEAEPELVEAGTSPAETEPLTPPATEARPLPATEAAIDAELLEVYLEEAIEVLTTIAEQLETCRADAFDREAQTVIRRSFHTLKGSGRMVGLFNLGDVAWSVEQVMNKLLQAEKPISHELLKLIEDTHQAFSGWVEELKIHGHVDVETSDIPTRAEALRQEMDAPVTAEPSTTPELVAEPATNPDEIVIGDVTVSAALFAIFREESERHLAALKHGIALLSEQGIVEPGFILAAHTLGGIVSTTGFRPQGSLAYALEHGLQQLGAEAAGHLPLLDEAVVTLDNMLACIIACEPPTSAPELISKLESLRAETPVLELDDEESEAIFELAETEALDLPAPPTQIAAEEPVAPVTAHPAEQPSLSIAEQDEGVLLQLSPAHQEEIQTAAVTEAVASEPSFAPPAIESEEVLELEAAHEEPQSSARAEEAEDLQLEEVQVEGATQAVAPELPPVTPAIEPEEVLELKAEPEFELSLEEEIAEPFTPETCHAVLDTVASEQVTLPAEQAPTSPETPVSEEIETEEPIQEEVLADIPDSALEFLLGGVNEDVPLAQGLSTNADIEIQSQEARRAEIEAGVSDDIDEQLLPIFIEEADELMPAISAQLHALSDGGGIDEINKLRRALHTMKGSARMSGAMRMGEAAHRMETLLEGNSQINDLLLTQLDNDYELLSQLLDEVSGRSSPSPAATESTQTPVAAAAPLQRGLLLGETEGRTTIRVKAELVDQLVNQAGEVAIARSRIEAEMLSLKGSLTDLTENVTRLRTQLREIEIQAESQMQARERELQAHDSDFDPLEFDRFSRLQELTRFIAESVNDVSNVQQSLLKNFDESNAALTAQARMTRDLQQSLMRVRLVPFNSLSERLYRLTRSTGKEVGKKVNLEIRGGTVEIDRGVLEKMISPFEHMLRNAIGHGLETPADRQAAGKPEFGEIQIEARQEGNELVLLLKDDGRGLNLEAIRAKGVEKGLISNEQQLSDHEISMLIFEAGFSTASNVTQLSGRGIGMDVVRNEISNLGGRIDLSSKLGEGTTFTVRLPLTLAVTQVLLVRAGERTIAIPSALVEQVQELKRESLSDLYAKQEQEWLGKRYPFAYFPRLLGDLYRQPEQKRHSTVLLLRSGADRVALHIDDLIKNLEVVVKPIGPQLARIPGVIGGTVLGTGEIVLIMNPLFLVPIAEQIAAAVEPATRTLATSATKQDDALQTATVVMVVDDSLTVRKITGRMLTREGFHVVTAKDGVDALQQLQDIKPAVMLVDIEMPRMDGFELTRNIKAAADTRNIPIIMITSRTADKHRKVAFDLGVNVFLGKPYQEDELLEHVRRLSS